MSWFPSDIKKSTRNEPHTFLCLYHFLPSGSVLHLCYRMLHYCSLRLELFRRRLRSASGVYWCTCHPQVESSWNVMAHGDSWEGKWRGNWRMEWLTSTLNTTSELCVSSITTADAHTSAASSRLNWLPCRFKWTRPIRGKNKSGFWACAITFQTQSTNVD